MPTISFELITFSFFFFSSVNISRNKLSRPQRTKFYSGKSFKFCKVGKKCCGVSKRAINSTTKGFLSWNCDDKKSVQHFYHELGWFDFFKIYKEKSVYKNAGISNYYKISSASKVNLSRTINLVTNDGYTVTILLIKLVTPSLFFFLKKKSYPFIHHFGTPYSDTSLFGAEKWA